MITHTGIQMNPGCTNIPCEMDIAVGMCRITRYAGALWVPLAAHSVLVGEFLFRALMWPEAFSWGLLHDAHETVTGEITRHYKPKEMKPYEEELDRGLIASFGISLPRYQSFRGSVKIADENALCAEATILGLKGWPDYYRRMENKEIPVLTEEQIADSKKILEYWSDPKMVLSGSVEQNRLELAFKMVKYQNHVGARKACLPPEIYR